MNSLVISLQVITALGIFNVWFIRSGAKTRWRGGEARNMKEEFGVYGLKPPVMIVAGGAKILCAIGLITGIWQPSIVVPSSVTLALLMVAAIAFHIKVRDPLPKSLPALTMLVLCLAITITAALRA